MAALVALGRLIRINVAVCLLFAVAALDLFTYTKVCSWTYRAEPSSLRVLLLADPQMMGDSRSSEGFLGWVDVYFNDWYFRFVVDSLVWKLQPTHTYVLGDLLSSEHISIQEFRERVDRFNWIFQKAQHSSRFISLAGNHDVGYGAYLDAPRIERFEQHIGPVNSFVVAGDHLLVAINSMNLDESQDKNLQQQTWDFIHNMSTLRQELGIPTLLFTHIPLHKPFGACVDPPITQRDYRGNVFQQNMISPNVSHILLTLLRPQRVFNGHDHEGCFYEHHVQQLSDGNKEQDDFIVPELTVRSMMAEFGGFAAQLQVSRNHQTNAFDYEIHECPFVTHVYAKVVIVGSFISILILLLMLLTRYLICSSTKQKIG